jgi:hypothetical protein
VAKTACCPLLYKKLTKLFNIFIIIHDVATQSNNLRNFVLQHGLMGKEIAALSVDVLLLALGIYVACHSFRTPREELTIGSIVSPLIALLVGFGFLLLAWSMPRARYLLRPGASRYTVATVYQHKRLRGKLHARFAPAPVATLLQAVPAAW